MPCAGLLNQQSWRWAHSKTLELDAGMSALSAVLPKQTNVNNSTTTSMSTFSGSLTKLISYILSASTSNFSGALTKLTSYILTASTSNFSGALTKLTSYLLSASTSNFAGAVTRFTARVFNASMSLFSGSLIRRISFILNGSMNTFSGLLVRAHVILITFLASMSSFSGSVLGTVFTFAQSLIGRLFPVSYIPQPQQPGGIGTPVTMPTETIGEQLAGFLRPGCNHATNHWEIVRLSHAGVSYVLKKCPTCGYVQDVMLASDYDNQTTGDPFNWY